VILQMAALGLGAIEDFPFLDPPDRRQVRDGVNLLRELGALDDRDALTPLGRRLAELPVDPRLGRAVLEADRLACANDVIVIVAGLSIQDPRERPAERRQHADQLHARFAEEDSDFIAYLNLWRYLEERQRALSGSAFRRLCRDELLHFLRVREWQDLVGQLRTAAKEARVRVNRKPAEPREVHTALLSGLLSHVGLRDAERREYQGARGSRFAIFPGSSLAKRQPTWVMAAELVETSRLFAREVARVEPEWIEPLAEHLVRREHSEPRWDRKRAAVVATERATLYGLPIVAGRTVAYGSIDPVLSRELFIRRALVDRDWDTRHHFFAENGRQLEAVDALEQRTRRRDVLVGDEVLFDFFDERIPADVVSGAHFDRWWRDERRRHPDLLTYTRELLVAAPADLGGRPATWKQGDLELALSYRFEPGAERDGVTVHVPLRALPGLRPDGFDWLVPALREDLVTALIRGLPKELRRPLVPVPEVAAEVVARLQPRRGAFVDAVARELEALRGVRVPRSAWDTSKLPSYLRMSFRVEDDRGRVVADGHDLDELRERARPRLRAELAAATASLEQHGLTSWTIGKLPHAVSLKGTGKAVRGYPALVDEGETVGVRVLESAEAQRAAMQAGTRRLLMLSAPSPARSVRDRLGRGAELTLAGAPHGSLAAVLDDIIVATYDFLIVRAGGPAWDEAGFARLRGEVAGELADATLATARGVVEILEAAADVRGRLGTLIAAPLHEARDDIARQLGRLVYRGFVAVTGVARLADIVRYLRGAARRIERLPDNPANDRDRMRAIHELEAAYRARVQAGPLPDAVREVPWLIEELRVSQFAQGLGTRQQVSAKRIRRLLDER
jgi:ATP-dependent helicase HrpA